MSTDFKCPHCYNLLNVGDNVVFSTRNSWGKRGLIILHPDLGNYTVVKHPAFEVMEGEQLEFYCPFCAKQLVSDRHENLAKIMMNDEGGREYEVHFSRIAGQHSTYKIIGESIEIFGKDASMYLDSPDKGFLGLL
jgi:transcription elongation factor Elf1